MPQQPGLPPPPPPTNPRPSADALYASFSSAMTDPEAYFAARRQAETGGSDGGLIGTLRLAARDPTTSVVPGGDPSHYSSASARGATPYSDPASGPTQGRSSFTPTAYVPGPTSFAEPSGSSTGSDDASGPVPGVRYCDPVPDARWPDGSEVCNRFHPQDPRWNWRPSFKGERPPWEARQPNDPRDEYDNYNTEHDGGLAQAKEQERVEQWNARTKRELCGPQLRKYKIPLTAKGQLEKYGTTFTNLLNQLGSSSSAEVKTARLRLIAAIRQSPPHAYVAPDPFYARCARQQTQEKASQAYRTWLKACKTDPACAKKSQQFGQGCTNARAGLPADDPRGTRWAERFQRASSAALAREKQRLTDSGWQWNRNTGVWSHPTHGGPLDACASLRDHWVNRGSNPRLWLSGAVEGAPKYPEGHPKAGQPIYAQDIHTLPLDKQCRFKDSVSFEPEFIQNNFFNEDGSRRSYGELLRERVITRDMLTCVQVSGVARLKTGVHPQLSADQIDRFLKDGSGKWKNNGDGTRMTVRDIVPELVQAGVLSTDDVISPTDADPVVDAATGNFSGTFSIDAMRTANDAISEDVQAIQVQGSPIPYYGSFPSQGAGTRFAPPHPGSAPLSVMGGVRAFPNQVHDSLDRNYSVPPNLSEGVPTVGASSIREFTVSYMDGSESWPALQ